MPREDPKKETSPIKDMMLPKAKKGHGPVICYRGNKEMRLLTLYYSYRGNKSRARQRKRVPRQRGPRTNPLFAAEKEWRSTRIVLGLLVSMTKMVLFASLLFDVLRFNYKGRKYQDSNFPQDFPQMRLENTSCWITSAEDDYSPDVPLQNPRNNIILPKVTVC